MRRCLDTPEWLYLRWSKTYGAATAHDIAAANAREPALDVTVKSDATAWAESSAAGCCRPARFAPSRTAQ